MKLKRPSPASVWLLALALAASACSSPDSEGRANLSQGDSAGVRIVVNPASALDRDLDWTIETTPWLELGADPNDEATQFFTIDRVGQMGQVIVVADGGNDQLRYFDLEGNHLRSAGRSGEGPGEFRWLRLVPSFRYDSLVLHDPFLRRLTSASAAGELRAEASVAGFRGEFVAASPSGHRLLASKNTAEVTLGMEEGVVQDRVRYRIYDKTAGELGEVFTEMESHKVLQWRRGTSFGILSIPSFNAKPLAAAGPRGFFIAPGDLPEVREYDLSGKLVRIVRIDGPARRRLDRERYDAHIDSLVDARASELSPAARLREMYGRLPVPDWEPFATRLIVDAAGNIWLKRFGSERRVWMVIDSTGAVRGRFTTPFGIRIDQIGEDFLLGPTRDGMGVQRVQRWSLSRR